MPFAEKAAKVARESGGRFTERQQKTNTSIIAKLRRTSVELSRMQDISACRIVVPTMKHLDELGFEGRRITQDGSTSHGYRATHYILHDGFYSFEIQLRTILQHAWAELSEKLADRFGQELKYGGGPNAPKEFLLSLSREIAEFEDGEIDAVMDYTDAPEWDEDPDATEGSPEHRAKRAAILGRMSQVTRFL